TGRRHRRGLRAAPLRRPGGLSPPGPARCAPGPLSLGGNAARRPRRVSAPCTMLDDRPGMSVEAVAGQSGVEGAIRRAARAVGVDFDFLMRTARRESALDPRARARTSSAAGLFQFIEQTWLATLHRHGA